LILKLINKGDIKMRLLNKVAIVTGGGSGLGRETCLSFASEGAKVIVADIDFEKAKSVVGEITGLEGTEALAVDVNVADPDSVNDMVEKVMKRFGRIDILINNAGITRDAMLHKMTKEQWDAVIAVNLTGPFLVGQAVSIVMREQGSGSIINTSSIIGTSGGVGQSNYAAAKAGMIGLTKTWSKELVKKGVRVNAVAPGYIHTPMTAEVPEKVIDMLKQKIPMGDLGQASDVANAYLFLASDDSKYMTGKILEVDGGLII
jgi:3-oxoacyl-[acyl-carrier protein] reductase